MTAPGSVDPGLVDHAVRQATLAPSVHNTQPWRFVRRGDVLELWADRSRQLGVLDPTGRLLVTSCGAALHHLHVALRGAGLSCCTVRLPDPEEPDLLATTTVEAGPAARTEEVADAVAELRRTTVRGRFDEVPLPPALLELLRVQVEGQGATLRAVRPEEVVDVQVLASRAERFLAADPDYRHELANWVAVEGSARTDGIPGHSIDHDPDRGELVEARHFFDAEDGPGAEGPTEPPRAEHPALVLLVTEGDAPRDWLHTGEALSRLLLTCTEWGVVAQPIGQVTDLPSTRAALASALGLLGHPQMLLRLGTGQGHPDTPRRELADVLEVRRG